jgi:hypothetical protein
MFINMDRKWSKCSLRKRGAVMANMFRIINQSISIAGLEVQLMSLVARLFLLKNNHSIVEL